MKTKDNKQAKNSGQDKSVPKATKSKPGAAQGLRDLFVDELKDIYWAEKKLTKAIPKMINSATARELAQTLEGHLAVTKGHVARLEEVFSLLGEKAVAVKCEAMAGLTREAEEIMEESEEGLVRDAGIISAGQKVEHYEIATYSTLCSFAKTLGEEKAATLLQQTLNEEREADERLSEISGLLQVELEDGNSSIALSKY